MSTLESKKKSEYRLVERETLASPEILTSAKEEEWETSKKVINHKTRQIETRVQRQILMEDGRVIADSGPQVFTRTKEDQKTEESENSNRKLKGDQDNSPGEGYRALPGEQVFSEKISTHNTTKEAKQENMQYHDESIKELSGYDIHRKALVAPHELVQIDANELDISKPRGKLTHYSNKSKKFSDREELKEVSKRQRDGTIATEKTRTHHHEEYDDDEVPEDRDAVKALPEVSGETSREVHFHDDYDSNAINSRFQKLAVEDQRERRSSSNRRSNSEFSRRSDMERDSLDGSRERSQDYSRERRQYSPAYSTHKSRIDEERRNVHKQREVLTNRESDDRYRQSSFSRSRDRASFKEDASVQASFSDDSSDEEPVRKKEISRSEKYQRQERAHEKRSEQKEKPVRTFYFGENSTCNRSPSPVRSSSRQEKSRDEKHSVSGFSSKSQRNHRDEYDWLEKSTRSLIEDLERECGSQIKDDFNDGSKGEMHAKFKQEYKSKVNDRVVSDTSRNESFHRKFNSPEERAQALRSFDELMDDSFKEHISQTRDLSPRLERQRETRPISYSIDEEKTYIPVRRNESESGYRQEYARTERDQQYRNSSSRMSNRSPSSSPVRYTSESRDRSSRLSNRNERDSSPNNGTWTKSKGRKVASNMSSSDWPEFSPLSAPSEILRRTSDYSHGKEIGEKKSNYRERDRYYIDSY